MDDNELDELVMTLSRTAWGMPKSFKFKKPSLPKTMTWYRHGDHLLVHFPATENDPYTVALIDSYVNISQAYSSSVLEAVKEVGVQLP